MNKKLSLLLAMLMLASTATACGDSGASETTADTETAADTAAVETEETENFDPGLPDKDFGGRTFTFMTKANESWTDWKETSISSAELTGEVLNDAVYNRNSYVQETYNVVLAEYAPNSGNLLSEAGNTVQSGDTTYDVIMPPLNIAGSLVQS
ncbi:MAG: hypothetical protein E7631_13130, partial [Ruminococcaceae bacterium]|nr:hypothetical protein [Oscillospiraceae bacterium]